MFLTLIPFATLQSHPASRRHHNKIKTVASLETCLASRNTRRRHETRSRVVVAYVFALSSPTRSSRDKSPAGSPITALTTAPRRRLRLRLHCCRSSSSWFRFLARLFLKKISRVEEEPPLHLRGTFASLFLPCLSVDDLSSSSHVIPLRVTGRVASGEKRVAPARTTLSVAAKRRLWGWRKVVGRKGRGKKKNARGEEGAVTKKNARENATREDPEESGGTFPPPLSVTHFSFLPLRSIPSREPLHYS